LVGCGRKGESGLQQSPRERLIAKIAKQTDVDALGPQSGTIEDFRRSVEEQAKNPKPGAVVSLEDLFEGNQDEGSIGCNLIPYPGLDQFYSVLKSIRSSDGVQDVLIEVHSIEDEESWPFSESIWILCRASEAQVKDWMKPLKPDEIWQGWGKAGKPPAAPNPQEGVSVYGLWWD
jgi:hypothetical protein